MHPKCKNQSRFFNDPNIPAPKNICSPGKKGFMRKLQSLFNYRNTIIGVFISCFLQIFPRRKGLQWKILRMLFSTLYPISHVTIVISLVSFFVTAFSFAINCALEMTFEMISPLGESMDFQNFYACCMLILLCCTIFVVCFVFSLFWEIIKVAVVKRSLKFRVVKVGIFLAILLSSSIHAACANKNFGVMTFLSSCLIVCWFAAWIVAVIGSVGLIVFFYREESHEAYVVVLLPMRFLFVMFSILSPVSFTLVGASTGAVCFAFFYPFLTACLILYVVFRGCRRPNGEYFVIKKRFALMFIAAYLAVMILATTSQAHCDKDCNFPPLNHTQVTRDFPINSPKYPICGKTYGTPLRLNIADMAYLSYIAYQKNWNKRDLTLSVNGYFLNRDGTWNVTYISEENPRFYHLLEVTTQAHIIGIRGTTSSREWFQYLKLWSEIISYQVTSVALPKQTFPLNFVTPYITALSFLERLLHNNREDFAFSSVESYVRKINRTAGSTILLTGHSIGGGLAKIVGSRQKVTTAAFSSPGEVFSRAKFGITLDDLQRYTTSVVSRDDMITWVDIHGGLVQYINCNASGRLQCHSIVNTYCELKRSCGFQTSIAC